MEFIMYAHNQIIGNHQGVVLLGDEDKSGRDSRI